jgi:DHA1 family bicyclomycin/chloramphenicol resistance-like MFS transporter
MKETTKTAMILTTVIFMDLLAGMEFDLFVPSFPQLQSHFNLTAFWVEALLSVNFIGYCLSLFFVGGLADRYGRKPIILLGLMTFIFGSMLCLHEQSFQFLLIGRFLQGIGIAAPAILSFLIIADTYPIKKQQFLMAMLNGSMNTAVAVAPVLGSYIALYFHWQGNFIALLILGLIVLLFTLFFIPSYKPPKNPESVLPYGYLQLFQSRPLMLLVFMLLINYIPYWIFVGMSPLLYIKDFGVSLHHFGLYQGSLALVFAIGSVLFGLLIKDKKINQEKMLGVGNLIFIASFIMVLMLCLVNTKNPLLITLSIIIFVIGQIIPGAILTPIALNFIPHAKGRISAIMQGGRLIFTSVAIQIAGFFYTGLFRNMGIIIAGFIFMTVVLLFFVIRNQEIMNQK